MDLVEKRVMYQHSGLKKAKQNEKFTISLGRVSGGGIFVDIAAGRCPLAST